MIKHWKISLLISALLFSPYLFLIWQSQRVSGVSRDSLAWMAILVPGLVYPFPVLLFVGVIMLILGAIGATKSGSKKFTFIKFGAGVLAVLTLILLLMLSRLLLK